MCSFRRTDVGRSDHITVKLSNFRTDGVMLQNLNNVNVTTKAKAAGQHLLIF